MIKVSLLSLLAITTLWAAPVARGFSDEHVVVKKEDRMGKESYEVMTRKEFYALEKECRQESFYSSKALMLAQRTWKENEENSGTFPRSVARPIRVRAMRGYKDPGEAVASAQKYTEREGEQDKKREEKLKRKHSRSVMSRGRGRGNNRRKSVLNTKSFNEAAKKQENRQAELDKACALYESMLQKCRQEAEERAKSGKP
jgi:hypothetical protein